MRFCLLILSLIVGMVSVQCEARMARGASLLLHLHDCFANGRDAWALLEYIGRLVSMLKLISTHDPWSFISSFRVNFNENEILLCSKETPSEKHLRVVVPDSSVEVNFGGVGLRVDKSDGESESGGEGGGCGEGQGELRAEDRGGSRGRSGGEREGGGGDGPSWSQSNQLLLALAFAPVANIPRIGSS